MQTWTEKSERCRSSGPLSSSPFNSLGRLGRGEATTRWCTPVITKISPVEHFSFRCPLFFPPVAPNATLSTPCSVEFPMPTACVARLHERHVFYFMPTPTPRKDFFRRRRQKNNRKRARREKKPPTLSPSPPPVHALNSYIFLFHYHSLLEFLHFCCFLSIFFPDSWSLCFLFSRFSFRVCT